MRKKFALGARKLTAVALLLVLLVGLLAGCAPSGLALEAITTAGNGIAPDTAFKLTAPNKPGIEELRENIQFMPDAAFSVNDEGEGVYTLQPLTVLDSGELNIKIYGKSFKFTVQNAIVVTSTRPSDGSYNVPTSVGVEVLFNTREILLEDYEEAFSISPAVKGEFTLTGGRYIFYPTEPMEEGTTYVVTLADTLNVGGNEETIWEGYTFSFTTGEQDDTASGVSFELLGNGISMNSLVSEAPVFTALIDTSFSANEAAAMEEAIEVEVHAYPGWKEYAEQLQSSLYNYKSGPQIDVSGLGKVSSFTISPEYGGKDAYSMAEEWILRFPDKMDEGYYAVTFVLVRAEKKIQRQIFLQVSDLSVFTMWSNGNLLAWINDAGTGEAVKGAVVTLEGGIKTQAVTKEDGTAQIANPPPLETDEYGENSFLITVADGERTFVDINYYYYYGYYSNARANEYITYMYSDRPIYRPTDTIQVWGVVRPRDAQKTEQPEEVTLLLDGGVIEKKVTVQPNGTFTAELALQDYNSSWAYLTLQLDDLVLSSQYITIEDFVKPIYTATTAPQKPVYLVQQNTTATIDLDVSLFEGTPVPGMTIEAYAYSSNGEETITGANGTQTTDSQGHLEATLELSSTANTWRPQYIYYQFNSTNAQDENFYASGQIYSIQRDVMLQGKRVENEAVNGFDVQVSTHQINIAKIDDAQKLYDVELLQGSALSLAVEAEIHRVYYTKEKTGTYYDYINMVSVDSYRYVRQDEIVDTRNFNTSNGMYTLGDLPESDDENCYYVLLRCKDSLDRTVETTVYIGSIYDYSTYYNSGQTQYGLRKQDDGKNFPDEDGYYYNNSYFSFGDKEDVTFLLTANEETVETMQGSMPFAEDLLPNYLVTGAYFDGKHIFALSSNYMSFDPEKRDLDIHIKPDKDTYAPAGEVLLDVTVTDKETGAPQAETDVLVSVVDEAVFAIQEQYPNLLESIYRDVYYPMIVTYVSYFQPSNLGGGEMGGGGDGGDVRKDFADTAYFTVVKTDENGKASVNFKLPDNITSWRVTSLALNEQNHAGDSKTNVIATKDFFVTPIVNSVMLEGDTVAVGLYGAGRAVQEGDGVEYTITIKGAGVNAVQTVKSKLRTYASAEFDKLPAGDYTITVKGTSGEYTDAVQLPFTVLQTGIAMQGMQTFDLAKGISIDPMTYPVSIVFYGQGAKAYNQIIQAVRALSYGSRADQRLAQKYIALLLQSMGSEWYDKTATEADTSDISGKGALLSLLPYTDMDLELSVRARLAAPDLVSANCLKTAEEGGYYASSNAVVYLARELAGTPLTANYEALLEKENLAYKEKIYLVMAMALAGDTEKAQSWYDTLVKQNLVEITGLSGKTILRVDVKDGGSNPIELTAAASMLATMLQTEHAEGLALYLAEKAAKNDIYLLEQMYYLTNCRPSGGEAASFSYVKNGETVTESLDNGMISLNFSKEQLEKANFKVVSGNVFADAYYTAKPDEFGNAAANKLGLTKKVEAVGQNGFAVGALVKITLIPDFGNLDVNMSEGLLHIDDFIPAGMRFVRYEQPYNSGVNSGWYLSSRAGQRLQFIVSGTKGYMSPIVYYARIAAPGEYVVESAYLSSSYGDLWGASERATVTLIA